MKISQNDFTILATRHSDDIDEIITKIPSWILRWGIVLFAGILLMVLSISAIIRYPETVKASIQFEAGSLKTASVFIGIIKIPESNIAN